MEQDRFISLQEAAALLGDSLTDVQRYVSTGLLDRYRVRDRYIRVRASQVAELATVPPEVRRTC